MPPAALTFWGRETHLMDTDLQSAGPGLPFHRDRLDALLDEAGVDVLVATSKHNIRYLLGGHHHHFFSHMDAIGISRYLPILVYPKGRPQDAAYIANRNEKDLLRGAGPGGQAALGEDSRCGSIGDAGGDEPGSRASAQAPSRRPLDRHRTGLPPRRRRAPSAGCVSIAHADGRIPAARAAPGGKIPGGARRPAGRLGARGRTPCWR